MLVNNHTHICHIMLYHFEKGWKAAQSFRDLNELFGEGTISESRCREWFARFKSSDTSLEDKPGGGETPGETQTFFLLRFLKRSHDSSPMTRFFRNGFFLLVSLQQIGENSDTFDFIIIGEFVGDPCSQP